MAEPIVFISHHRIKDGQLDGLLRFFRDGTVALEAEKPRTLAFLAYFDEDRTHITIVHLFADSESMDHHVQGADERSRAASEFMEPAGFEIYGAPSDGVLGMMREAAASGAELRLEPEHLGGFLRLRPD